MAKNPRKANGSEEDTAPAPTEKTVSIGTKDAKLEFVIAQPYAEGHTCTANEARALNQMRAENIGNNWRARVQATILGEEGAMDEATLRDALAKYDSEYVFTAPASGGSRSTMTPIEREARKIASALVMDKLKSTGRKKKDVEPEKFEATVSQVAASDEVQALAKQRVEQLDALASVNLTAVSGSEAAA